MTKENNISKLWKTEDWLACWKMGHFTYDAMGNMLTDSRNGLEFSYNLANLPEIVEGADGATLTYIYLGLSDFGARYYDPFTCRWTTRDPMAGKYHSLSPYNYCAGNPTNLVDPNGAIIGIGNVCGALAGAGAEYFGQVVVNAAVNLTTGKGLKGIFTENIDLADIGVAAVEGFFTLGASAGKNISKKGAKVLISAVAGAVAGSVDITIEDGIETGSAQSVITGAVAGTLAGSADPGIKTKNVMTNTSSNKATNKAREKALNKGHGLPTEEAKRIAAKNSAKNSEKAAINNAINNSVNDAVMSSTKWFNNYIWMMEKEQQNQ